MVENFTLLPSNDIKCAKCEKASNYILLDSENNFLGFYCYAHGIVIKLKLEEKYQFEKEMSINKCTIKKPRYNRKREIMKRQLEECLKFLLGG